MSFEKIQKSIQPQGHYGKMKNSEFDLYDSIVNGRLRPYLPEFSSETSIKRLIQELNLIKKEIHIESADSIFDGLKGIDFEKLGYKDGDQIQIEIIEEKDEGEIKISPVELNELKPLIDIDIPPPPDLKAEYFLDLIENEFEKILISAKNFLNTTNEREEISFYANKNIQIAKRIAADAHDLSKRLKSREYDLHEDSDTYIMYILKLFLKRAIADFQSLFEPFLDCRLLTEDEIRTDLYEQMPAHLRRKKFEKRLAENKKRRDKELNESNDKRQFGPNFNSEIEPSENDSHYVFSLIGDFWKVRFNGDQTTLRNLERIRYIVHLIDNPNKEFYCHQLTNLVKGNSPELSDFGAIDTIDPIISNNDENDFQKITLDDFYELGIEPEDRQAIEKIAKELWEKRNDPELSADEKSKAKDAWVKAVHYYSSQYGILLKSSKNGPIFEEKKRLKKDYEKARTNVRKHIKNAIEDIDKKIPSLSKYLENHINTGFKCVYEPSPGDPKIWTVNWFS